MRSNRYTVQYRQTDIKTNQQHTDPRDKDTYITVLYVHSDRQTDIRWKRNPVLMRQYMSGVHVNTR